MLIFCSRTTARRWLRPLCGLSLLALLVGSVGVMAADSVKRPLTHADYDAWRSISSQTILRDGRFLAYFVMPEEGDGEIVVRNLVTNKEWRHARGGRGGTGAAGGGAPAAPAAACAWRSAVFHGRRAFSRLQSAHRPNPKRTRPGLPRKRPTRCRVPAWPSWTSRLGRLP